MATYTVTLTGDQVTYQLCTTHAVMLDLYSVHSANYIHAVSLYMYTALLYSVHSVTMYTVITLQLYTVLTQCHTV